VLTDFIKLKDFHYTELDVPFGGGIISTFPLMRDANGINFSFSGNIFYGDNFFCGVDDIKCDIDIQSFRDCMGEFELLMTDSTSIECTNDFFGYGKWFYYHKDNTFVASTSYHLLILLLRYAGITLKINTKHAMANTGTLVQQKFTNECDIHDIFLLPPDKKIIIRKSNGAVEFHNTLFFDERRTTAQFSEEQYEKLLMQAKNELISNVRAIFTNPRFKHVRIDITDGLDSRLVLAIAMNLPKSLQKKIRVNVHNHYGDKSNGDFKTACAIANMLNLQWGDDIPHMAKCIPQTRKIDGSGMSAYLSSYYKLITKPLTHENKLIDAICLTGAAAQPSVKLHEDISFYKLTNDQVDSFLYKAINDKVLTRCSNAKNYYLEFVHNDFSNYPGNKKSQLQNHYEQYRNRFHNRLKYFKNHTSSPLQSLAAYQALRLTFNDLERAASPILQHDLMTVMHPLLSVFPHILPFHNDFKKTINKHYPFANTFPTCEITPDYDSSRNTESKSNLPISNSFCPDRETYMKQRSKYAKKDKLYDEVFESRNSMLSCLKTILNHIPEMRAIGFDYFRFIMDQVDSDSFSSISVHGRTILKNKLLSLCYQIQIIY